MSEKPKRLYFVLIEEGMDCSYWETYESISGAVERRGDNIELFGATLKRLGKFKKKISYTRIKQRKRVRK